MSTPTAFVSPSTAQPTAAAQAQAAREADFAQAEFRRCVLLSVSMIETEIERLNDVFTKQLKPAALALAAQDFTEDLRNDSSELRQHHAAINGPVDALITADPDTSFLITRTARDIQNLTSGLAGSLADTQRRLDVSQQQERERLERGETYRRELAASDDLHRRRLAGEAVEAL